MSNNLLANEGLSVKEPIPSAIPQIQGNQVDLLDFLWPKFNQSQTNIVLYWSNGEPFIIKPGERMILPKQVEAFHAMMKYDCTLFGGAVGGSKSDWLRKACVWFLLQTAVPVEVGGLGLTRVEIGLFCEKYTTLRDRQISKIRQFPEWLGKWKEDPREFHLHSHLGGGVIKCRNLQDPAEYSSAEFGMIAIDELTFNTKPVFDWLRTRRRWPPLEHCPIIAATNPGQVGHGWVLKEFVDPDTRTKPHYDEELDYYTKGNGFIQSLPRDNPFLTKQYWADLKQLPDKQRRALVDGDWSVFAGQYFSMLDPYIHRIKPFDIPDNWNRFRAIDYGEAHPTSCVWMAMDHEGNSYFYREYSKTGQYIEYHKQQISELSKGETYRLTVGDPAMFPGEHSVSGRIFPAEILNARDSYGAFGMVPAVNARVQGWQALANGFSYEIPPDGYKVINGKPQIKFTRRPKIFIFDDLEYLWRSLTTIVHDDVKVEDVKKSKGYYEPGMGDDEAEAARYCFVAAHPTAVQRVTKHLANGGIIDRVRDVFRKQGDRPANSYARF